MPQIVTNPSGVLSLLFVIVTGSLTSESALAQAPLIPDREQSVLSCPAFSFSSGETAILDCAPDGIAIPGKYYQWTSEDIEALGYLDDLNMATPRFSAPTVTSHVQQFTYHRIQTDAVGKEIVRMTVQVRVHPSRLDHDCELREGIQSEKEDVYRDCSEVEVEPVLDSEFAYAREGIDTRDASILFLPDQSPRDMGLDEQEGPDLHCPMSVTASGGAEAAITCFGQGRTDGLLQYTAEFDWPPYRQSVVLEGGRFDYTIQVPDITQSADLRSLKLIALDLQTGASATQDVELHITNEKPQLQCEDIDVREGEFVRFPCNVEVEGPLQFQIVPQSHIDGMPSGMYDHIPSFVIPDVQGDTTVVMIVRVVETSARRLTERQLRISVSDSPGREGTAPMDFVIDCGPERYEVYEGGDDIPINCTVVDELETENFTWTWAAEGDTPYELLEIISGREAIYLTPESVEDDVIHSYSIAAVGDQSGSSNQVKIQITVLEKPDISVECQNVLAYVGDPPIQLSCTATNDKQIPDLDYMWTWDPADRLSGDLSSGTPLFDVPADQTELSLDYTYEISVSAPNADPPDMPAELTVTVERILGTLALSCDTPVVVYEGSGDLELDCVIGGFQIDTGLMWDLQLISGPTDLLTVNPNSLLGPIFAVPETVSEDQTYEYEIGLQAPYYLNSETIQVTITVLKRPILSLNCENEVIIEVSDPPRRLMCEVLNDRELDLEYTWLWTPDTRLSDTDTGTPLFDVPEDQRVASENYDYEVIVSAPNADAVTASVRVTVRNTNAFPEYQLDVNPVPLNFGTFASTGVARLDPASEEITGVSHDSPKHTGRLVLTARDSLMLNVELFKPAILRHRNSSGAGGESASVTLYPSWSYTESCVTLAAETLTATSHSIVMEDGDCRQLLFGGEINLDGAEPGMYTGDISVLLTTDGFEVTHTVPASLTVERARRVISLGPRKAYFGPEINSPASLDSDQSIRIYPLKAVLSPKQTSGIFQMSNPSMIPLEVSVTTSFGYLESRETQDGQRPALTDMVDQPDASPFGDLSRIVQVYPSVFNLMPGESKEVRYAIDDARLSQLDQLAYAMFVDVSAAPRQYTRQDQLPSPGTDNRTAVISTRIPGVYVSETNTSRPLIAVLESISDMPERGLTVTLLIEAPDIPFAGQVVILGENGQELGRADLFVYTRSRVMTPLASLPGNFITLKFIPDLDIPAPSPVQIPLDLQ